MQLKIEKAILGLFVLLSNVAIIAGAATFGWSRVTVIVLFVFDALLGAVRMSVERLFAGKPRDDDRIPAYPIVAMAPSFTDPIYESLLDKRGTISIGGRMPTLYPRNIPYALEWWILVASFSFLLGVFWLVIERPGGSIDVSLWPVLVLIVARHVLIVSTWTAAGVYEQASTATVRRGRELIFSFAITVIAILLIAPESTDARVAAAAMTPMVLKLLFDFREAGIGLGPLTFDPSSNTTEESIPTPLGESQYVYQSNSAGVSRFALLMGMLHVLTTPGLAIICLFAFVALVYESLLIGLAGVFAALLVALVVDYVSLWLAHGNLELRVCEDGIMAYDRFLEEPQWVVPFEDVRTISIDERALKSRILSSVPYPIEIERMTDDDIRVEYIEQPEEFVRNVRKMSASQSNVA